MGKRHGLTNKNTEQDNNNNYRNGSKETGIYRNHKDGVAYKLFSGKKESLSLYNSIMRTDYTDPDEIEVVTLNSAIYIGRKNDNAIILHFNMLLTEFQTTFNPNMPLRTLIYVSNEYEKYIAEHESNLYSEYIQKIPTPYFVTLYYGSKEQPEKQILRLSDAYKNKTENPELELMVTQYNVNPSYNEELKRRCPELDGYIKYVEKTRKYHKTGMTYEEAVKKSVDECIEEGILKEFFVKNKAEVISMTIFEYDEEEHMRLEREEQYRKGEEAGEARGIEIGEARGEARGIEIGEARGETIKISAPVTKPNSTRTIEFDGWAYDKTYTAIKGVKAWFDDETDEFYISASDDADMNADTPKIYMGTKTDIDGTTYKLSGGKDCTLVVKEALATPTPTAEVSSAPAVSTKPSTAPTNGATTAPTNRATTAPTNGATTAPTNGATTAPTSGATNTPAPVTSNTPAPTSDATPAPTEAPKGNMDKFNVAFNYVADDKWGEQSWGDKSVDVTGDGKYEISYTAQSDTTDIFMMILSTDLYKGSLNKDFKLVPTTVSVGKTDYKVNAKGGWCFSDQEETNAYRYNIVNPYNGPIGSDGVTYVDPAVTSIDGLGTVPVKKGDTIKVSFTVSGMKSSTSAKSKAKVTVSKKTVTVAAGKSTTVSYKALNKAGKAVKASAKTSNKKLATVKVTSSKKIKISVPKKATKGSSAKITLTSAGKKATITVKVANPVKSAKAAKKTVKIKKGKKAKITVKVTAQNKKKATTDKLTAKSSKSKIAKITGKKVSKGKVTVTVKGAKKGTSKLTIKIGKKSVKVTVKVK